MAARILDVIPLNDLTRSVAEDRQRLVDAVVGVVDSGWYVQGREQAAFERTLADTVGVDHAVAVGNGTDALELALIGVGCAPGDEIVTVANAGMYATTAALNAGLRVRYADVDPDTLCLSRATLEAALTSRTKAVVATHLYGQLADIEEIGAVCDQAGVSLVEDCAQAAGATRSGRFAGAFGDAAAFSFYPTKNIGALGDAGAVVTRHARVAGLVRSLGQYGWEQKYEVVRSRGRNSRMDEIQAAVLRVRLPRLAAWNSRRREIVGRFAVSLPANAGRFVASTGPDFVGHLAVFLAADRSSARESLEQDGISTGIHYPIPDHRQPVWLGALDNVTLPVTEDAARRIVTVPCFPELEASEVERICEGLRAL